jgi:hypothetical protein
VLKAETWSLPRDVDAEHDQTTQRHSRQGQQVSLLSRHQLGLSLSEKTLLFDQRSFGLGLPTGLTTLRLCEILSGLGCTI